MVFRFIGTLALLLFLVVGQDPNNLDTITLNNMPCPLQGTAEGDAVKQLNTLKGRYQTPGAADIDPTVTLTAMIAPGDDESRFNNSKAATVIGYVYDVVVGGVETCNCGATDPLQRDTHMFLILSDQNLGDKPKQQAIVAEVTPRSRIVHQQQTGLNDWTTDALQASIKGKWVQMTGWLLFDFEHVSDAENTNPGAAADWRATCWELHPVTDIKILPGPPSPAFRLDPAVVSAFQKAQAAHVDAMPGRRKFIEDRNKKLLGKIDEHDRDKDEP